MNQINQMNPYSTMGMYGGYQTQYQQQYQPRQRLLKCYPVTSIDEARAAMVDVDGSVTVFTDLANGKIYTKAVDLNGLAILQTYELAVNVHPQATAEQRIEQLETMVNSLREEIENVKQSNNPVNRSTSRKPKSAGINESNVGE